MIHIRRMTKDDLPLGMRLKDLAGWNQTSGDWQRFQALQPDGCFVAEWDGLPVATTTTCIFGSIAWIAMVLVDPAVRGRGVGSGLMRHAIDFLKGREVKTIRLDATPLGSPMYERLGFAAEYELARMARAGHSTPPSPHSQVHVPCDPRAWKLDRQITGTGRSRLLERLRSEDPLRGRMIADATSLSGYVLTRTGSRAMQIGPCIAINAVSGRALCDWAVERLADRETYIDIPVDNTAATKWATDRGLVEQRRLTRMCRGVAIDDRPDCIWASSGPEMG